MPQTRLVWLQSSRVKSKGGPSRGPGGFRWLGRGGCWGACRGLAL